MAVPRTRRPVVPRVLRVLRVGGYRLEMLYIFDVNETLLDMSGLDGLFAGAAGRREWFELLVRTALTRTAADAFRPFGQLGLEAARSLGFDLGSDDLRQAMSTLSAHADVAEGLAVVGRAGHTVVALGNSSLDLVEDQLQHAGIRTLFDEVFSAETAGVLKPAPAAYASALGGVAPTDAVLVAAHDWDVAGAAAAGLRTVLIDRGLRPALPGLAPDKAIQHLGDCVL